MDDYILQEDIVLVNCSYSFFVFTCIIIALLNRSVNSVLFPS